MEPLKRAVSGCASTGAAIFEASTEMPLILLDFDVACEIAAETLLSDTCTKSNSSLPALLCRGKARISKSTSPVSGNFEL